MHNRVFVVVAAIAFVILLFSRDALARLAWHRFQLPWVAIALDRHDATLTMNIGNYYFGGGSYDLPNAERAFERAVAINPKILWGHFQLARVYFVEGDFIRALEAINAELAANPENLRSLYVRGLIYGYRLQIDDLEFAENDFQRFTEWAPSEWAGYNDLAWILARRGHYVESGEAIMRAFQNIPDGKDNPWLWNSLGVAELNQMKYTEAIKSFETAQKLAESMTTESWRRAYPGNDPATAPGGLAAFLTAIGENLSRSQAHRNP